MKANEFVKDNPWLLDDGIRELKGIISDAKEYKFFCLNSFLGHSYDNHGGGVAVSIDDLKRLVESHELVKEHGTIERAKQYADSKYTTPEISSRLKQAIADVESCKRLEVG